MSKKLIIEDFSIKAKQIHGDVYDYSKLVYKSIDTKIDIGCLKCFVWFKQTPRLHLKGHGCPCYTSGKLSKAIRNPIEHVLQKIETIHPNKFDLSLVNYSNYKNGRSKIPAICKICGFKLNSMALHLMAGHGCPNCAGQAKLTQESFLIKAAKSHGNKYDYTEVKIKNNITNVLIICKKCSLRFEQTPKSHIIGSGCPRCSGSLALTRDEIVKRFEIIHCGKYDYSNFIEYNDIMDKISIICKNCVTPFNMTIHSHLYNGSDCPSCIGKQLSKGEIKWLDSIGILSENRQYSFRVDGRLFKADGFDPITNTIYEYNGDFYHGHPNFYASDDINWINYKSFGSLYAATLAREAAIRAAGYNLIVMWEHDWKAIQKASKKAEKTLTKKAIK